MTEKNEAQTLKALNAGAFRDQYIIYTRKSTDDTDNQKNSIKYQRDENQRFALRSNLPVAALTLEGFCTAGVVSEHHSGFKEDPTLIFGKDNTVQYRVERPKFHRLVHWLGSGYFKGAIFLCWDRASRNKADDTILRKLMKGGSDIRFAFAQYDKTSSGELHMDIDGMFSEHYSRVTREKVTLVMREKLRQGVWVYKAPVGYLNTGTSERKPFDPERAPILRQIFEKMANEDVSLAALARWANSIGFCMPPMRRRRTLAEFLSEDGDEARLSIAPVSRPLTANGVHQLLTNRFYTGRILTEGKWISSSSHEALVSDELFERVQRKLRSRRQSAHYEVALDLPLRGMIRCGLCRRLYTPYTQKKSTYYGARCHPHCGNLKKNFSFAYIVNQIRQVLEQLSLTATEVATVEARAASNIDLFDQSRQEALEVAERRKKKIREDLSYLNANRLTLLTTGAYTPEALVAESEKLDEELKALTEAENAPSVSPAEAAREVQTLSELIKSLVSLYDSPVPEHKDRIVRAIFSELTVTGDSLQYQCKMGIRFFDQRSFVVGAPTTRLPEFVSQYDTLCESADELRCCIADIEHDADVRDAA